jgi:hypothetical protein
MSSDSDSEEYPRAPAQKARDENILGVFEAIEDPVLTTSEVAEELPIGKRATLNRLEDLVERDEIDSKDVGVGRVWWRMEPEEDLDADPLESGAASPEPTPEPAVQDPETALASDPAEPAQPAGTQTSTQLERDSPRWAFIRSLGRHSILAGGLLIGLLITETLAAETTLLPVSVTNMFLTAIVFFMIGFPALGAYRTKKFFESTDLSLSQFLGPLSE